MLLSTLSELEQLLRKHGVRYAEVIRPLRQLLYDSTGAEVSPEMLRAVRELFGGMGSLNDVYVSKRNGHVVEDEAASNHNLAVLTERLWEQVAEEGEEPG